MIKIREKNVALTFVISLFSTLILCIIPFVVRAILIRYIGIEYVGVSSLFTAILQVLNLTDFGIDIVFSYFFYKPAAEENFNLLNAYMNYLRKVYHRIGFIMFAIGIMIAPFLPYLVKDCVYPKGLNIYIIYIVYLINASFGYLTNGYILSLLPAFLLSYIHSFLVLMSLGVMYLAQIIAIVIWHDYYIYTFLQLLNPIIMFLLLYSIKRQYFPWLDFRGEVDELFKSNFKKRMKGMLFSKIRNISRNSLDSIVISYFLGLVIVAKYQNYYQTMCVPLLIMGVLKSSVVPSLGNGIALESKESNKEVLKQYTFIQNFIATTCLSCLLCLLQPFMKLWTGVDNLLPYNIVFLMGIYFYVLCIADIPTMLRETTGIWYEGRWIAVVESVTNLILNVILVFYLGVEGVVLASIITVVFINIPFELFYVFRFYFNEGYFRYILQLIKYSVATTIIVSLSYLISIRINIINLSTIILRVILAFILPVIFFILFHINNKRLWQTSDLLKRVILSVLMKKSG